MYNVSDAVVNAYMSDGVHKEFKIEIGETTYYNDQIVDDSFSLKQSISDSENFEAIGCIASSLSVELRAQFPTKQRGQSIVVSINAGNTGWIKLFTGQIDECTKTANGWRRQIEAYDYFYKMSGQSGQNDGNQKKEYDITEWYNEHSDTNQEALLREVCGKFGLTVDTGNKPLVNGPVIVRCQSHKASSLSALDLIKTIMQINGCFGYITAEGHFSWKYLVMPTRDEEGWLYPSAYLYPSTTLYPGQDTDEALIIDDDEDVIIQENNADNLIGWYEHLDYQDFQMLPINEVVVRNYEKDEEFGSHGSGENKYIIQGNLVAYSLVKEEKNVVAKNLYDVLNSTWYVPFNADLQGLPFLGCGDPVHFYDFVDDYGQASLQRFYIFSRTLSGGQHLKDSYSANGNEYQHEFISGQEDNASLDEIKEELDDKPDEEDVQDMIDSASGLTNIVSVAMISDIPNPPNARTLYCVQTEVEYVESLLTDYSE